jgi:hypothetical protein
MSGSDVAERPLRLGNGIAYRWLEDRPMCFPRERGKKVQGVLAQIPWRSNIALLDKLDDPDDKPSIGLLLCSSKSKLIVEYALRGFKKPIGVADWETRLVKRLPKELRDSLPTVEEIETELTREGRFSMR